LNEILLRNNTECYGHLCSRFRKKTGLVRKDFLDWLIALRNRGKKDVQDETVSAKKTNSDNKFGTLNIGGQMQGTLSAQGDEMLSGSRQLIVLIVFKKFSRQYILILKYMYSYYSNPEIRVYCNRNQLHINSVNTNMLIWVYGMPSVRRFVKRIWPCMLNGNVLTLNCLHKAVRTTGRSASLFLHSKEAQFHSSMADIPISWSLTEESHTELYRCLSEVTDLRWQDFFCSRIRWWRICGAGFRLLSGRYRNVRHYDGVRTVRASKASRHTAEGEGGGHSGNG
jgi:hypothetical protein